MAEIANTKERTRSEKDVRTSGNYLQPACPCRIALYDDLTSPPQIIEISPQETGAYFNEVTEKTVSALRSFRSEIPFMVVRECVENLIHARFQNPTISILNRGKTIRFSDQGPGIQKKEAALKFGTTTATEEMKSYIRGVGSGLPIASQYMQDKGGYLCIEDNLQTGCIVTLGFLEEKPLLEGFGREAHGCKDLVEEGGKGDSSFSFHLQEKETQAILLCLSREKIGPTDLSNLFGYSLSTWTRTLQYLVDEGLLKKPAHQQKYFLTALGRQYATHYI